MNPTADFTEVPTVTVPCAGGCQVQDRGRMIQVPCAGLEKEHPDIEEITGNFTGETCGTGGCFIVSSELVRTYYTPRSDLGEATLGGTETRLSPACPSGLRGPGDLRGERRSRSTARAPAIPQCRWLCAALERVPFAIALGILTMPRSCGDGV